MARIDQVEALFHEARALPQGEVRLAWLESR